MEDEIKQRAHELYVKLGFEIVDANLTIIKTCVQSVIPPGDLQHCHRFEDICQRLSQLQKIGPKNHTYLHSVLSTIGREDLAKTVKDFDREVNDTLDPFTPVTCLYNKNVVLPKERLDEFLDILNNFIERDPDTIPQQLFYTNAAAGIARPDEDLSLHLGKDLSVSVPKGAVKEKKIIHCYFVESTEPCLLASGNPLVCYSVPVLLGPPGEEFQAPHPVVLDLAHNAAPTMKTCDLKFYTREGNELQVWQEAKEYFCIIREGSLATVLLPHFSEFVIGVDASTTSSLPPLRSRVVTSVINISDEDYVLILCVVFDSAYMMKKVNDLLHAKSNGLRQVTSSLEILLHPSTAIQTKIEAGQWATSDSVQDITPEELSTLVFKPIVREIKMVREKQQKHLHSEMCQISISQTNQNWKFVVLENTFVLARDTEQQVLKDDLETAERSMAISVERNKLMSVIEGQYKLMERLMEHSKNETEEARAVRDEYVEHLEEESASLKAENDALRRQVELVKATSHYEMKNLERDVQNLKIDVERMKSPNTDASAAVYGEDKKPSRDYSLCNGQNHEDSGHVSPSVERKFDNRTSRKKRGRKRSSAKDKQASYYSYHTRDENKESRARIWESINKVTATEEPILRSGKNYE